MFKTYQSRIKFSKDGADPKLLKVMGFEVIIDESIPEGEIHFKDSLTRKLKGKMINCGEKDA